MHASNGAGFVVACVSLTEVTNSYSSFFFLFPLLLLTKLSAGLGAMMCAP